MISVEVDISELHNLNDILSCLTCDDHAEPFQLKIDINFTIQYDVSTEEIYSVLANSVDMIHKSADATSVEITPTPETLQLCSEIVKLVATEQLRPTIIFNPATTDVISDFMRNCVHCPMSIKADLTELSSAVGTIPYMSIIDSVVKEYHSKLRTNYHEVELIIRKPTMFGAFDADTISDRIMKKYGTEFPFKVTVVANNL